MPFLESIPTVPLLLLSGLALTAVVMLGFGGSILFDNYRGRALPAQFLADVEARLASARERLADILAQIAQSEPQRLEVEKLKYLKEALDDDIRSLEARLSGMDAGRSEVAQLETQIGDLLAQRAAVDEGLLAKKGEVAEAEARLEAAERRTISLETVCAELEGRRDAAIAKLSELTPKLDAAERQIAEAQRLIDAARAAEAAKAQLEQQITGLKIDHEQLRQAIARLEADRGGIEDVLAEAKAALASSRERARTLEAETTQAEVRLETALARQDAAENEARTAEAAARARSDEIAALGAALAPLRAERDGIADAITTARATLAALHEKARDQRGALSADGAGSDAVLADLVGPPAFLRETVWKAPLQARQETEALDAAARHIERVGLRFGRRVIRQFHTSLKINDVSQLTVLAGVSGTGKSQLPQRYAEAMGIHFLMVPVQPRWDSPQELLGFYNYIEQRYRATEFARALVHFDPFNWKQEAEPWSDRLLIVLLDEMNLARVECNRPVSTR